MREPVDVALYAPLVPLLGVRWPRGRTEWLVVVWVGVVLFALDCGRPTALTAVGAVLILTGVGLAVTGSAGPPHASALGSTEPALRATYANRRT